MTDPAVLPHLVSKGVLFRLEVDSRQQECMVSKEALARLSGLRDTNPDPLEVFYAFQPAIQNAARRLVRAGASDTPLVLGPDELIEPPPRMRQA
jgi:hypothetical protein